VQNTLGKLQLHNRIELVRYAIEHGLAGDSEPSLGIGPRTYRELATLIQTNCS